MFEEIKARSPRNNSSWCLSELGRYISVGGDEEEALKAAAYINNTLMKIAFCAKSEEGPKAFNRENNKRFKNSKKSLSIYLERTTGSTAAHKPIKNDKNYYFLLH